MPLQLHTSCLASLQGANGEAFGDPWSNPWDGVVIGRIDSDVVGPNKVHCVSLHSFPTIALYP